MRREGCPDLFLPPNFGYIFSSKAMPRNKKRERQLLVGGKMSAGNSTDIAPQRIITSGPLSSLVTP